MKETLTAGIRSEAKRLGFEKVGFVPAERLNPEGDRYLEWLERGYHGEMGWMARNVEKRVDPAQLMDGARSLVVVAKNYFTPHQHEENASTGKISRYAWGDDYHDVLKKRLFALLEWIEREFPGVSAKVCVDTAPILEKAWAVRAGIGWLGKHTNVITTDYGSWVFLGEIVLDIELEYDEMTVEDHCGTCTACLDACPTNAIVEPYLVDSNLCISHATIELRDEKLPPEIVENLDGWLYGCDICQDVCPWNRFEEKTDDPAFEPRPGNVSPELESVLEMTREEYVERFRGSAIKRTKLSGLKRNAAALAGRNN